MSVDDLKKTTSMVFKYTRLIKEIGPVGEKDVVDIYDSLAQSIIDKLDHFVDYRYSKNKYGMHKINITVIDMPTDFDISAFTSILRDHCDDVGSFVASSNDLIGSVYIDIN